MDLFNSPAELKRQLAQAEQELETVDSGGNNAVVFERLRQRHPNHPLFWLQTLFSLGFVFGLLASLGMMAATFWDRVYILELQRVQGLIGISPIALGFGVAGACFVAWAINYVILLLLARGEEPLELEAKERQRITQDIARIRAAMQLHERAEESGTPLGALPRGGTPIGAPPLSLLGSATPPPIPGMRSTTPAPVSRPSAGSLLESLGAKGRGATPLGAAPRGGAAPTPSSPIGSGNMAYGSPASGGFADFGDDDEMASLVSLPPSKPTYLSGAGDDVRPEVVGLGVGFNKPTATVFPTWGPIEDPWLIEQIQASYVLAQDLPLQAAVAFNAASNLPFTLVLERASPAIAMRATMAYAEFLARIATPVRARVDLAAVPHLSGNFSRNVMSALSPHFGEKFELERRGDRIEISFAEADAGWNNYPTLPTE